MQIFRLEQTKVTYQIDFAFYGLTSFVLAISLLVLGPREHIVKLALLAIMGFLSWTLIEYVLHRFVLHGVRPFSTWHAEHHQRPTALICTPTILSATLIFGLVFLPVLILADLWQAYALTFGILIGYLIYTITHHAIHHWRTEHVWLLKRKRQHALHHQRSKKHSQFGVTSGFWDHIFYTK